MNNKTKITWEKRIKLTDTIIKEFPENFKDIINKHIDSIEDSYEKMDNLYMVNNSILNCFLNHEDEYSKAELNYLKDVKKYCHDIHEIEGRIFKDGNTKGKLTPKQMKKYGEKKIKLPKIDPTKVKESVEGISHTPNNKLIYKRKNLNGAFISGIILGVCVGIFISIFVTQKMLGISF